MSFSLSGPHEALPSLAVKMEEAEDDRDELEESVDSEADDKDELEPPATKRTRTGKISRTPSNGARRKQGRLEGLMKMPIDIFTQIAYLLNPADLISLIRANKFLRNLLLRRSAVLIWRRAESNVLDLPPCPPGICEPQYAALLFSKCCTLCGASATAKPDTHLFARLCTSCRDNKLVEIEAKSSHKAIDRTLVNCSCLINMTSARTRPRGDQFFGLKSEIKNVKETQRQFQTAKDSKGLAAWEVVRRKAVSDRHKHAYRISSFLRSADKSRGKQLRNVKEERRDLIISRLKALGWTNRDMLFHHDNIKPWKALVDAAKPLTKRIWGNILPKLTVLLEENRARHLERDKMVQRINRRKCVDRFLTGIKYSEHPLEPITKALGAQPPAPPLDTSLHFSTPEDSPELTLEAPFPNTVAALDWDCLADLSSRDITTKEVQAELDARKDQIELKVSEWRTEVEQQFVEQYQVGTEDNYQNVVVTVKGSSELTAHLSPELRLLLRADTISRLASSCWESFDEDIWYPPEPVEDIMIELGLYRRHSEMEKVVQKSLGSLGMPDVRVLSSCLCVQGLYAGDVPMAGRKRGTKWMWNKEKSNEPLFPIRYPIVYRNMHDFSTEDNPKPLVQLVTEQESERLRNLPPDSSVPERVCLMCDAMVRSVERLHADVMSVHMRDVHDISAPVENVHYGSEECTDFLSDKWHKRWNAFHDAQSSSF